MRRLLLAVALPCLAQPDFSQRGFIETRFTGYPQVAPNDRGRGVAAALFRYEAQFRFMPGLRLAGGIDTRADTHHQVERAWRISWQDRSPRRPPYAVRRMSLIFNRGPVTLELGKQFIRWGKADILNPTDRFAPRDFLDVVDNDFLAVTAVRLVYGGQGNTLELVWSPRFTPSRTPLLNQRWAVLPEGLPPGIEIRDAGAKFPGGPQVGARWNHAGSALEYSFSFYNGYNHLPLFEAARAPLRIDVRRVYPRLRTYGGDAAVPLRWLTLKGEAAYFTSSTPQADEYILYVIQLERQAGEWFFVGGYAGQRLTRARQVPGFAPDRGLSRAFLGRAGYTIDVNRSVTFEAAARQNGKGLWLKTEYSQALGQHWRVIAAFTLVRGAADDFLGQYRRNSHLTLTFRYSF